MSESDASEVMSGRSSVSDWSEDDSVNEESVAESGGSSEDDGAAQAPAKKKRIGLHLQLEIGQYGLTIKDASKAGHDYGLDRQYAQRYMKRVPALLAFHDKGASLPYEFLSLFLHFRQSFEGQIQDVWWWEICQKCGTGCYFAGMDKQDEK